MASKIQLRSDKATNWTRANPILAQGELGYETDTKKFKIGDGVSGWRALEYFTSGGGGGEVTSTPNAVSIATINALRYNYLYYNGEVIGHPEFANARVYKGNYQDITFTLDCTKEYLVKNKEDIYFTIERNQRNNSSITKVAYNRTFSRQNDRRYHSDIKMYCWRYNPAESELEFPDDKTQYIYFYTTNKHGNSVNTLFNDDPQIWFGHVWDAVKKYMVKSNWVTCLNALETENDMYLSDYVPTAGYTERYAEGDIETFTPCEGITNQELTVPHVFKMNCKIYKNASNQEFFMWCKDWTSTSENVYMNDEEKANFIPKSVEDLTVIGTVDDVTASYSYVKDRKDLVWYKLNPLDTTYGTKETFIYKLLRNIKEACAGEYVRIGGVDYGKFRHWNVYWFDYPIVPIRLSECEVMVENNNNEVEGAPAAGTWVNLDTLLDLNETTGQWSYIKVPKFRLPYDTYYLLMRQIGWQKYCFYYRDQAADGTVWKNNLIHARWDGDQAIYGGNLFGGTNNSFVHYIGGAMGDLYRLNLKFNIATADEIAHNYRSQSREVKVTITLGGNATQALR